MKLLGRHTADGANAFGKRGHEISHRLHGSGGCLAVLVEALAQHVDQRGADHDAVGAFHHAIATESLAGPVNVCAPGLVTNAQFTRTLGRVLRRPAVLPVPAPALRIAFGELADGLLLASQRALSARLEGSGFSFVQPELEAALRRELGR